MKNLSTKLTVFLLIIFVQTLCYSQIVPTGSANIEETLRRQQLLGNFESSYSFSIRPLRLPDSINSISAGGQEFHLRSQFLDLGKNLPKISALPIELRNEYNSHHPISSNNGSKVPGRGYQFILRTGIDLEFGPLNIYLKPEIYYSQNLEYEGFPDTISTHIWQVRYIWWNEIDLPEKFGDDPIFSFLHGQSKISFDHKNLSLGVSTENIWWGPGKRNSLIMTNNARGFLHLSFNTKAPLKTPIGSWEWQVIAGRLERSGFSPPFPSRINSNNLYNPPPKDWRYLSAISLVYSPKWLKGVSFGINRMVQQYSETAVTNKDYFPIILNVFRQNDNPNRQETFVDQAISTFVRFYSPVTNSEFYFEYGRNDAALNLRDLIMSPEHSRAFIIGLTKLFELSESGYVEVNMEVTQLQESANTNVRYAGSWYLHSRVRDGYTNRGEVLGAGIGPGSNSQSLEVNWVNDFKKIGIYFERLVHNNDFFLLAYSGSQDWRRYWVDLTPGIKSSWNFDNLVLEGNLLFTRSLNYQWELHNSPGNNPYFVNGRDVSNFHIGFHATYFFNKSFK